MGRLEEVAKTLKIFELLLHKTLIIRRRYWIKGLLVEILIPAFLFLLIQSMRELAIDGPRKFEDFTVYDPVPKNKFMQYKSRNYTFYYHPENNFTKTLMTAAGECFSTTGGEFDSNNLAILAACSTQNAKIRGFPNLKDLKSYLKENTANPSKFFVVVSFDPNSNWTTKNLKYEIRLPAVDMPRDLYTADVLKGFEISDFAFNMFTEYTPIAGTQICIDESILHLKIEKAREKYEILLQRIPEPPHIEIDRVDSFMRLSLSAFALFVFLLPMMVEVNYAADEKFIGVNVLMQMHGVPNWLNSFTWLISSMLFNVFYLSVIVTLLNYNYFSDHALPFIRYSNSLYFWIILFFVSGHLFAFGIHMSMYFSRSLFMISGLMFIYIVTSIVQYYIFDSHKQCVLPYLGVFFPNILLFRIFQEVNNYESLFTGINWSNMFTPGDFAYGVAGSSGMILIFSMIGIVFHMVMANYIYNIHPGEFGIAKHPLYFLKCFQKKTARVISESQASYQFEGEHKELYEMAPPESSAVTPGIQIRNLKKIYSAGLHSKKEVRALKGISVDFYKSEITVLLGRNGAGKTTMMSILTGMANPTSGSITVDGKNMKDKWEEIQRDMGLCPQKDMLFPNMSVLEQVRFFGMLKGHKKSGSQIKESADDLLRQLNLFEKRHNLPKTLSGGQKRRTCLAMSFVGDPSVLVLDEPTSGMDPKNRRDAWDIILRIRRQKTVLISTHDMEEADILGDRIAIMDFGLLKSFGTPMFLKKILGKGNMEVSLSTAPDCDFEKLREFLIGKAEIRCIDGTKVILHLPNTPELPKTLDLLDRQKKDLGLTGLSTSLITLEQVFLEITRDESQDKVIDINNNSEGEHPQFQMKVNLKQTLIALLNKKLTYSKNHWIILLTIIFLPIFGVSILYYTTIEDDFELPALSISLDMYPEPVTYYRSSIKEDFGKNYKKLTEDFHGQSTGTDKNISIALISFAKRNKHSYQKNLIAAADFKNSLAMALYNDKAFYSIPISINALSNAVLKSVAGNDSSIGFFIGPQIKTSPYLNFPSQVIDTLQPYVIAILYMLFLFPAIALFSIHPLRETISNIKQLQRMAGVSWLKYWGTIYIFDLGVFGFSILLTMLTAIILDRYVDYRLMETVEFFLLLLIFVLFAMSSLPFVYVFTFIKKTTSGVLKTLSLLPMALVISDIIMLLISSNASKGVQVIRSIQKFVYTAVPHVNFCDVGVTILKIALKNASCRKMSDATRNMTCEQMPSFICCRLKCGKGTCEEPLSYFAELPTMKVEERSLDTKIVYLFVTSILYIFVIGLLENNFFSKIKLMIYNQIWKHKPTQGFHDEKVEEERIKVDLEIAEIKSKKVTAANNAENATDVPQKQYLAHELYKTYRKFVAVDGISFRVKKGQCFGLLGVNGAGKSTTFRLLTGAELPNKGEMCIVDKFLKENRNSYLSQMGYCPQSDAFLDSFNAYDLLRLFGHIRGIPNNVVETEVRRWITKLNLNRCASQPSGTYSGGNKRRLNMGMALIGNPNLILLDEPSAGVDPAARRLLWSIIRSCKAAEQSIILTSHSMDECEALCTRIAIMVRGKLVCIGACEELKQRFQVGYNIEVKFSASINNSERVGKIKEELSKNLEGQITDESSGHLVYHVTQPEVTWVKMYDVMNAIKSSFDCIEDFIIQSSTLEQLFLKFARGTDVPKGENKPQQTSLHE